MPDPLADIELPEPRHEELRWPRILATCGGILLVSLGLTAALVATRPRAPKQEVAPARVGVEVYEVRPREVQPRVVGLGRSRPRRAVAIAARVSGQALTVHPSLRDGMHLPAGELAVQVDPADFEHAVARAAALHDAAQAEEARLRAQVAYLSSRVDVALRQLAIQQDEQARIERLQGGGVGTDRDLQQARTNALAAESAMLQAENARDLLGPQLDAAVARVREAEAALEEARLDLARAAVRTPFAGQVAHVAVEAAEQVSAGVTLFELWETEVIEVPVPLPLDDAALLAQGQGGLSDSDEAPRARVRFEAGAGDLHWDGLLRRFEPVDPSTQTVKAVVEVRNEGDGELALAANVFCKVEIDTAPVATTAAIPQAALQERDRVYLVRGEALAVVEVVPGRRLGGWVEIRDGLAPGDLVIVSTLEKPIEGTPLTVSRRVE